MLRRAGSVIHQRLTPLHLLGDSGNVNLVRPFSINGGRTDRRSSLQQLRRLSLRTGWTRLERNIRFNPAILTINGRGFASDSKPEPETPECLEKEEGLGLGEMAPDVTSGGEVQYTLQLTDEEIQEISKGDPELIKKIKYIQLEHEVYRQEGSRVPTKMKMKDWREVLGLSRNGRKKYYSFLWLNEMKTEKDKLKKKQLLEERYKDLPRNSFREDDPFGMDYGLNRNTLFLRLYDTTVHKFYHGKMASAMIHSRPLVLDCGYDEFMTNREAKNCAKQLEMMLSVNRTHQQPYDIHLCNAQPNSKLIEHLQRIIPTIYEDSYPLHVTEKSYLDIFPHKELVYLTPHARDSLEEYDEDEVYIIGAMVDKSDPRPFSLAKAKKENLKMKKLPLDSHLMWGMGTKSLTVNQMVQIMLDIRYTKDWTQALDHVPKRKLQRDFHPYPSDDPRTQDRVNRHESQSKVLQDFELMNQRKGYRKSDSKPNYFPRSRNNSYEDNNYRQNQDSRYNRKSIRYDNE